MGGLTHVALFSWKAGTTDRQIEELSDGLATLPAVIPEILAYRYGSDAGLRDGNLDFAVVADFADAESYRAYAAHPAPRDVIDRLLQPIVDRRASVQFESSAQVET